MDRFRSPSYRRTRRTPLLALAALATFATALVGQFAPAGQAGAADGRSGAAPATAQGAASLLLASGHVTVPIHGANWQLQVSFIPLGASGLIGVTLLRSGTSGFESHSWALKAPLSALSSNGANHWQLKPAANVTKPVATIALKFAASGHSAERCSLGSAQIYSGSLSGMLELTPGLKGVGTLGGSALSFSGKNTLTVDHGCIPKIPSILPCAPGAQAWSSTSTGEFHADATKASDMLQAIRMTSLAKPAGAGRSDAVVANEPGASVPKNVLHITTKAGGVFTGSATATGKGHTSTQTKSCTMGGTKHSETTVSWEEASLQSSLVAHTALFPAITVPSNSALSAFSNVTVH
jgi:hypothetical protein